MKINKINLAFRGKADDKHWINYGYDLNGKPVKTKATFIDMGTASSDIDALDWGTSHKARPFVVPKKIRSMLNFPIKKPSELTSSNIESIINANKAYLEFNENRMHGKNIHVRTIDEIEDDFDENIVENLGDTYK